MTAVPLPAADPVPQVRSAHGLRTPDPYAWMKGRRDDPRLMRGLTAERAYYDAAVAGLLPMRATLTAEFVARLPDGDEPAPWPRGPYWYVEHTPVGAQYAQLCRRTAPEGDASEDVHVVLDTDEIAAGHGYLRYGVCEPSPDGRYVLYSVDFDGDEVYEMRLRDTATGVDTSDRVARTYYGCAWSADSRVFFYVVHDNAYRPHQVFRHAVGTDPADDVLIYAEDDERYHVCVSATRTGSWIVISSEARDTNEQWVVPADDPFTPPRLVERRRPGVEYFVEHLPPDDFAILTNDGADEYRVVRAPAHAPGRDRWAEWVPGSPTIRIRRLDVVSGYLVLSCRAAAEPFVRVVRPDGSHHDHLADTPTGLIEVARRGPAGGPHVMVLTESVVMPRRWWSLDLGTGERAPLRDDPAPQRDPSPYRAERTWATAQDGERIPITLAYRRDAPRDGTNRCLLHGYGAYESCADQRFSATVPSLLDRGFVYAVAHVRGGGELGRRWWLDGRLAAKRNTFTDFVAVRDHLVGERWVAPDRVICRGLSAGGLLTGAVYTFWPDRWAGVIAEAPAVDLLNQMLDPATPLTVNEYDEWGDPADREQFEWMRSYTPYENVTDARRPPLLVTGIRGDPRVMIHEPAKWVAALRAADTHGNQILFRAELGPSGHRGPSGRHGSLAYEAEIHAWIIHTASTP